MNQLCVRISAARESLQFYFSAKQEHSSTAAQELLLAGSMPGAIREV
jgi:hypothetical protein